MLMCFWGSLNNFCKGNAACSWLTGLFIVLRQALNNPKPSHKPNSPKSYIPNAGPWAVHPEPHVRQVREEFNT